VTQEVTFAFTDIEGSTIVEPLLERAAAIREKSLGSDHPFTVKVRASLAVLRGEMSTE
jgi:hypothetical protein